jgi:23S rRNA (uracil1939-C5)-methyltransferase
VGLSAINRLARAAGLPPVPVAVGYPVGFRHRARLAIRGHLGSPKLGLFERDSHRVVHIPNCSVHHPLINWVAAIVRSALIDARVSPYSDGVHLGLARYLQISIERSSQTAQVVLVTNSAGSEPLAPCLELIRQRLGPRLHSLWLNCNRERSNTILGPEFHHWCGPESMIEHFGGAAIYYPPGAFGQNNLDIAQQIIEHVRLQVPAGARVAEFYAGVGAIGLSLLPEVGEIRLNEINPHALQGLELGVAQLDAASRAKILVVPGTAGAARQIAHGAALIIADPPRKGLDAELRQHLGEHPPERLIYVSCGIDSFLNDAAALTSAGKLRLAKLNAFDLLPYTRHVETVGIFERA